MRLAFSSSTCPNPDLDTLIRKAKAWGYEGFELAEFHTPTDLNIASALRSDLAGLRGKLEDANQQIVALNAGVLVTAPDPARGGAADHLRQTIELAAEVACPLVTTTAAPAPTGADKTRLLDHYAGVLHLLANEASAHGVTLALENTGALALSQDIWHVRDAVSSPALRICLNPLNTRLAGDSVSLAVKRLGAGLALVHLADATFSAGAVSEYVEPGKGAAKLPYVLELLKGLAYRGWICLGWPAGAPLAGDSAEQVLQAGARFLRGELDKPLVQLTAYKGDKNAPKYVSTPRAQPATATP